MSPVILQAWYLEPTGERSQSVCRIIWGGKGLRDVGPSSLGSSAVQRGAVVPTALLCLCSCLAMTRAVCDLLFALYNAARHSESTVCLGIVLCLYRRSEWHFLGALVGGALRRAPVRPSLEQDHPSVTPVAMTASKQPSSTSPSLQVKEDYKNRIYLLFHLFNFSPNHLLVLNPFLGRVCGVFLMNQFNGDQFS